MKEILRYVWYVALFVALLVAISIFGRYATRPLPEDYRAMGSTLPGGQRIWYDRRARTRAKLRNGDVVIFKSVDAEEGDEAMPGRILAKEGETIEIKDGTVFVDGEEIEETYVRGNAADYRDVVVPRGHVFILFDNRSAIGDSRTIGPVPYRNIEGKVVRPRI